MQTYPFLIRVRVHIWKVWQWILSILGELFQSSKVVHLNHRQVRVIREGGAGEGGFGFVDEVADVSTGEKLALKRCLCQTEEALQAAKWEIQVMTELQPHSNIIPILDHAFEPRSDHTIAYMLMPLCQKGSLNEELNWRKLNGSWFGEDELLRMFEGICSGLYHMHSHDPSWAHRDIKTGNVLLDKRSHPYLTDFGSCRNSRVSIKTRLESLRLQEEAEVHSTMSYRPPELFDVPKSINIDERTDVWSLGCLLYAMAFGQSPFDEVLEQGGSVALAVTSARIRYPKHATNRYSPLIRNLIDDMCKQRLKDRPFVSDILERVKAALQDSRTAIRMP